MRRPVESSSPPVTLTPSLCSRRYRFTAPPALRRPAFLVLAACQSGGVKMDVPSLSLAEARAQSDPRYAGIVVDVTSGAVLYAEDADSRRHPASLTKLMTLYVLFDELKAGRMSLATPIPVSAHAARMPASKLGLKAARRSACAMRSSRSACARRTTSRSRWRRRSPARSAASRRA